MSKSIFPLCLFLLFASLFSCGNDDGLNSEEILIADIEEIETFLADNNLTAQRTADDLFYIIEEEGNGVFPALSDDVTVDYHGYFTNNSVFDSSVNRGTPATFPLSGVIEGWQKGIPLFSKGGKGKLILPSRLAYGVRGTNGIPGNSVLVFDVHLIRF